MANYSGNSIVDYLKDVGKASDFSSRTNLATQYGITNYQGTAEQNTQLLGMLRGGTQPATTTTPTPTTSTITPPTTNGGELTMPTLPPTTGDTTGVNGLISYYQEQIKQSQKAQADYQAQLEAQRNTQQEETKSWLDKLTGAKSQEEKRAESFESIGVSPQDYFSQYSADIAELDTLSKEYNSVVAIKDQQVADVMGRAGQTLDFQNNSIAQIERNASIKLNQMSANINSKAAILEAKNNRWNEANQYVNQAVSDYTADLKWSYDMYNLIYDKNQDIINNLDTKYQNALSESKNLALNAWQTALTEQTEVGNLMISNPKAGIQVGDTIQEAQTKAARYAATQGEAPTTQGDYYWDTATNSWKQISTQSQETKNWTDFEFRTAITNLQSSGATYEEALQEIENDPTILNKEQGKQLAKTIYGVKEKTTTFQPTSQPVYSAGKSTKGVIKELFTSELLGKGLLKVGDFFSGLFGK